MKIEQIKKLISQAEVYTSKWELDNVVYWDRATNPSTLLLLLERIVTLSKQPVTNNEKKELEFLQDLLDDVDLEDAKSLLKHNEEESKTRFIENLARKSAIETLTTGKISIETMETACKMSPNDFILCAKRTQDLINAIHGLVIKGETLSSDVAGA